MDTYFEIHPLRNYSLTFKNNKVKNKFLKNAIKKDISNKLHEIYKSETDEEERKRKLPENI